MASPSLLALAFGPYRRLPLVNRLVGQPFADDAFERTVGALHVVYAEPDAVAIAKIELRQTIN